MKKVCYNEEPKTEVTCNIPPAKKVVCVSTLDRCPLCGGELEPVQDFFDGKYFDGKYRDTLHKCVLCGIAVFR